MGLSYLPHRSMPEILHQHLIPSVALIAALVVLATNLWLALRVKKLWQAHQVCHNPSSTLEQLQSFICIARYSVTFQSVLIGIIAILLLAALY